MKIKNYFGTWSIIDTFKNYHLLEHAYYGDETCYLVVDSNYNVICETYDDIKTALKDKGLIY